MKEKFDLIFKDIVVIVYLNTNLGKFSKKKIGIQAGYQLNGTENRFQWPKIQLSPIVCYESAIRPLGDWSQWLHQ